MYVPGGSANCATDTSSGGINYNGTPPEISAAYLPSGIVGIPYNFAVAATGSTPITFTATGLPPGIVMSTSGVVTGAPAQAGQFAGTITASNGLLPNAARSYTMTVASAPAVNGVCGSANGVAAWSQPSADLCSAGAASVVSNASSWTWTCSGSSGGFTASCSASKAASPFIGTWPGVLQKASGRDTYIETINPLAISANGTWSIKSTVTMVVYDRAFLSRNDGCCVSARNWG